MERLTWLNLKKQQAVERYNQIFSKGYDTHWGKIDRTHEKFITGLAVLLKPGETVLDAACGTGKYWPLLKDYKLKLIGVDQSRAMLDNLRHKFPGADLLCSSLQNLELEREVAAVICVDAMENIPPEDWPGVIQNLSNHLSLEGLFYLTVELEEQANLDSAYVAAQATGLPVVPGEVALEGYHFYPQRQQVLAWLQAGFQLLWEEDGDGYWHLLCRKSFPKL